ncbi:MAG: carbohydrate-binding domain-containing protein [Eubacteriales bacterium]|nr:carbohydrate-binding domain-containing protein [Eubacteriales bacterium]
MKYVLLDMKKVTSLWLALLLLLCALPAMEAKADDLFSDKDLTVTTAEGATPIVLNNETVTINQGGSYAVSGEIANGSLRIVLTEEDTVYLLLNGVSIRNEAGAALYTENCKKVVLTLAEGTENILSQGATANEEETGALMSRDDLTINGQGSLTVISEYKDGINCRDTFKLAEGNLTVTAADDGIVGKDAVIIGGGVLNITAVCDGIKATNEEDTAKGYLTIAGGDVTIVTTGTDATAADAAQTDASSSATMAAPEQSPGAVPEEPASPGGTAMTNRTPPEGSMPNGGGGRGGMGHGGFGGGGMMEEGNPTTLTSSAKGLKAITAITVSGGTVTVHSADDAVHASDVLISGGTLSLTSGDDGVHADDALTISGGTINIPSSYEGLEGTNITISGGTISLVSTDDGVNGAGGDAAESSGGETSGWGFGGRDMFSSSTGTLTISGGMLMVDAAGDGIDVNGSFTMSGGQVYVNGPSNSNNGALDYDGSFTLTGGSLIALGQSGMAQGVTAPSVPGIMTTLQGTAGTFTIKDGNGNAVLTMEAVRNYQSVVAYSDQFTDGGSYTLETPVGSASATMSITASVGQQWGR